MSTCAHPDPFRGYLGTLVSRHGRQWVVVDHTVRGAEVLFHLRDLDGGQDRHVTLLELLELLELQHG